MLSVSLSVCDSMFAGTASHQDDLFCRINLRSIVNTGRFWAVLHGKYLCESCFVVLYTLELSVCEMHFGILGIFRFHK